MDRDRDFVDQNQGLVEHPLQNQDDTFSCPLSRDLNPSPVPSRPLRVAQPGELRLPDAGRSDGVALAAELCCRTLEFEVPQTVERQRRPQGVSIRTHDKLPKTVPIRRDRARLVAELAKLKYPKS